MIKESIVERMRERLGGGEKGWKTRTWQVELIIIIV